MGNNSIAGKEDICLLREIFHYLPVSYLRDMWCG